jgi:hypothetical protein
MNRWIGMLVVGMAGLLVFSARTGHAPPALLASPDSPPASSGANAPLDAAASDSVRIEYELIGVRAPRQPKVRSHRLGPLPAVQKAEAGTGSKRFVARASRVLIGDGRYRPEPFPRPDGR